MRLTICGNNYDIGSSLYPVKDRKNVQVFYESNTTPFKHEGLEKWIDTHDFKAGFCYTNAELLRQAGQELNLPIEFYAGWVFIADHVPVHHAWAVIDGNVIDTNFRKSTIEVLKTVDYQNPLWREGAAMRIKAREKRIPLSKDCIMGKVFENILFAGTKDTCELSKMRYNTMIDKFPNHPSYQHKPSQHDMTPLQKELYKRN